VRLQRFYLGCQRVQACLLRSEQPCLEEPSLFPFRDPCLQVGKLRFERGELRLQVRNVLGRCVWRDGFDLGSDAMRPGSPDR
jgi:hypothetical protein